jgi:hypothetical protein
MKKNLAILLLIGLLLVPTILLAALAEVPTGTSSVTSLQGIVDLMDTVAKWIYAIVFALAIVFILVAAFQFLTAAGSPEKVASARGMLIYALIAVAVAVIAWGLPTLVKSLLGVTTTTTP